MEDLGAGQVHRAGKRRPLRLHHPRRDRNDMPGARTIPSKLIPETDRSDRPGEDREFMDRFKAEEEIRKTRKELSEPNVEKIIGERKAKRRELDNLLSGVDDLINDENE